MRTLWISALVILILDQVSKYWVVQVLDLKRQGAIDVWDPFLNFRMAWNEGVNFGLFSSSEETTRWILIAVAVAIVAFVLWWVHREQMRRIALISAGVMIGGAIGNVIDRVVYGAVADFLNMSCCGIANPYSFNVADIAVFAGAIGLVFFTGSPAKKKAP
jgi:signal peptidase II